MNIRSLLLLVFMIVGLAAGDCRAAFVIQPGKQRVISANDTLQGDVLSRTTSNGLWSELKKPVEKVAHLLPGRKYRGRLSAERGYGATSIAAGCLSTLAILLLLVGLTSSGGAFFYLFLAAIPSLVSGFVVGLVALICNCRYRGFAIFSVALFALLLILYAALIFASM